MTDAIKMVEALLGHTDVYAKAFQETYDALAERGVPKDLAAAEARNVAMMAIAVQAGLMQATGLPTWGDRKADA